MRIKICHKIRQVLIMTNSMDLSALMENVILTKIILTTDGTIGCVKHDTWCQNRNIGKFQLVHLWDEVLLNTLAFYLK